MFPGRECSGNDLDFTVGLNMSSCLWYCLDRADCVAAILNGDRCWRKASCMPSAAGYRLYIINSSEYTQQTRDVRPIDIGKMLGRSRRRWANIKPTLVQRLVFAGRATVVH